jgi:hypothetical protein
MRLEFLIAYSSFGSIFIPLAIAFFNWKKTWNELRPLCLVLILSLLSDSISFVFIQYSLNTYWIVNIYLITQFLLVAWIFKRELSKYHLIDLVIIVFIIFGLINLSLFQGPWVFNSVSNAVASLILISFCLLYFYQLLNELPIVHVQHLPMFWIAFGVLTYYSGNFFLFLVNNYLLYGEHDTHQLVWILHNLLNLTKNLLFAIALWQSYRKVKSSTYSVSAP